MEVKRKHESIRFTEQTLVGLRNLADSCGWTLTAAVNYAAEVGLRALEPGRDGMGFVESSRQLLESAQDLRSAAIVGDRKLSAVRIRVRARGKSRRKK